MDADAAGAVRHVLSAAEAVGVFNDGRPARAVWYVAGEYGGGAWTIQRADGTDDRVDINDIRASAGIEMTGPRGVTAFVEGGFVFKRQVIYVVTPADSFHPRDTYMIRAGISF